MPDYDVIVIGAGCGGVTAAALLAKRGYKTLLLEQSERIGGCCSTFERDGFHFDVGASIVESAGLIDLAFQQLGAVLAEELELVPADPIYSVIFRDGSRVDVPLSLEGTEEVIARLAPGDVQGFRRFCARFGEFLDEGGEEFFVTPLLGLGDLLALIKRRPVLKRFLDTFVLTYQDVLRQYIRDERVQQLMCYQSFYAGHSPDLTPGIFAVIPFSEHKGLFYPKGGMIRIPQAIAACGQRHGLEVRLNTLVNRVLVRKGRVEGVALHDGVEITARIVVSNVNAKLLYLEMIGAEHLPRLAVRGIKSYEPSLTSPMIYLGVDYRPELGAHHSLFTVPMAEMNDAYWNHYREGRLPGRQFGLICWPTASDPSLAPAGHHVLNLILQGPYQLQGSDWDVEKPAFMESVIADLSAYAVPGLAEHIVVAEMSSPRDFERRLLVPGGAFYGFQQDLSAQTVFRPSAKSRAVQGLYLVGASTHPGGGVPTTIASGLNSVALIERYEA